MAGETGCSRRMQQEVCPPHRISKSLRRQGGRLAWLWQSCWPQRRSLRWVLQLGWGHLVNLQKAPSVVLRSCLHLCQPPSLCCLHGPTPTPLPSAVGAGVAAAQDSETSILHGCVILPGRRVCECRLKLARCTRELGLPGCGGVRPSSRCRSGY